MFEKYLRKYDRIASKSLALYKDVTVNRAASYRATDRLMQFDYLCIRYSINTNRIHRFVISHVRLYLVILKSENFDRIC